MVIIIYATHYTSSYVWVGLKVVAFTCVCLLKCVSKCLGVGGKCVTRSKITDIELRVCVGGFVGVQSCLFINIERELINNIAN